MSSGSPFVQAYGGFEQVGPLGRTLPRNDVQITTEPGDLVLYAGNQLVVFYGSNTWAYTQLGHITDKTQAELTDLLGSENAVIEIALDRRIRSRRRPAQEACFPICR